MNKTYVFIACALMAIVTYLIRMIPFTFFTGKIKSRFIRSFLYYIPYAVLTSMTFPAILYSTGSMFTALCGTVVALIMALFKLPMALVAISASVVVFITSFIPI